MRRTRLALLAVALSGQVTAAAIDVLGSAFPPLLQERAGTLSGPYADAFALLARARGISVTFTVVPVRRVLSDTARTANSCALAVPFDPGASETLTYVGRIAPISLAVYARRGMLPHPIHTIADLAHYSVGTINSSEARDILLSAGIPFQPLDDADIGWRMLNADRFTLFVSDRLPPPIAGKPSPFVRVFTLARLERWVACQANTAPGTLAALRRALREGAFAMSTRSIWRSYRLDDYFLAVRHDWVPATHARGLNAATSP